MTKARTRGCVDMKKSALPQSAEQFTISFDKKNESMADLNLDWGIRVFP